MNDIRNTSARSEIKRYQSDIKRKAKQKADSKAAAAKKATLSRRFDAVQQNRMFADWITSSTTTDSDINDSQPRFLNRARDKAKNSGNLKKFLDMLEKNVVFTGFTLHSKAMDNQGNPDEGDRAAIEKGWKQWGKKGVCTMDGKFSFAQAHRKLVRDRGRDGEYLVREIMGSAEAVGNKFGYAWQIIPIEALDFMYSKRLSNGNVVIMGVELNKWNRPVAYHILKDVPDNPWKRNPSSNNVRERIPADQIIHGFKTAFENQTRGIPEAYAMLTDLHQYESWEEAVLVGKRIMACISAYYETPEEWDDEDLKKFNPPATTEPGSSEVGVGGVKKTLLSPGGPTGQDIQDEQRAWKRDMATALDVAYHTFANDLENVNFSSIRAGVIDERDGWRVRQQDEVDDLLERSFLHWLEMALLNGALTTPQGTKLPASKFDKFAEHEFQGRTWQWVDPLKDAKTNEIMRDNTWKSDQDISIEVSGKEFIDNAVDHQRANTLRSTMGLQEGDLDTLERKIQQIYLGVGRVITTDEARKILNETGADLQIPAPKELKMDTDRFGQPTQETSNAQNQA
jgi:lambda family phage portal protein